MKKFNNHPSQAQIKKYLEFLDYIKESPNDKKLPPPQEKRPTE